MGMPPSAKPPLKPAAKSGKKGGLGSRTRFLTVNRFRMDRVGRFTMGGITVLIIAAVVWCVFYFIR